MPGQELKFGRSDTMTYLNPPIKMRVGMYQERAPTAEVRARVEIIPLIDVMFLLVAFFMGVSISMVMQKRSFVDLSPAETADTSMEEKDTFVLSVEAAALF